MLVGGNYWLWLIFANCDYAIYSFSTLKPAPHKNYNGSGGLVLVFQYQLLARDRYNFYRAVSKCLD